MRVLVTGATGFVGRPLVARLLREGHAVRALVRRDDAPLPPQVERVRGDVSREGDWRNALDAVDVIVHLAARVHVMRDRAGDPLAEFRRVNVEGTMRLARRAADAGVRRFVYLSSVKVNGESGAYTEDAAAAPEDAYGISKSEAETALRHLAGDGRMQVVIIRPPLVYGPGVRANFAALMRAVKRGLPLPLGAVRNRRSLVGVDNLVDFIITCMDHPAAANQTFFVSDGEDLSTAELIRRLAHTMGRRARLVPVPSTALMGIATLAGYRGAARRLLGSLQVDISKARRVLGWAPAVSVDEGLRRAASSQP